MLRRTVAGFALPYAAQVEKLSDSICQVPVKSLSQEELYTRFLQMRWFDRKLKQPSKRTSAAMLQANKGTRAERNMMHATGVSLFLASNKGSPVFRELTRRQCTPMAAWNKLPQGEKDRWEERARNHVGFPTKLPRVPKPRPKGMNAYHLFLEEISRDPRFLAINTKLRFKVLGELWSRQKAKIKAEQEDLIKRGVIEAAVVKPKVPPKKMRTFEELGLEKLASKNPRAIKARARAKEKRLAKAKVKLAKA